MSQVKPVLNAGSPLSRNWGWLLGLGILFVILGCIGLSMLVGLTLVSMFFFAVILVIAGFSQIVDVFKSRGWQAMVWHALIGFLYLIAGGLVMVDPLLASTIMTAMLAWLLIVIGAVRLIMAWSLRHGGGWGWVFFAGLCSVVLGILILMQWPWSGLWVIGMFIAIELLVNGWSYVFLALAIRSRA